MALYHKYRPQKFSDVIGQEHIIRTVSNQVANQKLAHAYLFCGPRGVGKTTIARLIAKAVNCRNRKVGSQEPCNNCTSCQETKSTRAIDVIEIDAASHTGVDNVRENIIDNARFKPTLALFKVFIIDEVHMLSTSAFNALLKTLEEPPSHVIFILATTELHKLPETIVSRCQRYQFQKVGFEVLRDYLHDVATKEKIKVDEDVISRVINKSDGCVRDAMSLLDQLMATGEKRITAKTASIVLPTSQIEETILFTKSLIEKDAGGALEALKEAGDKGVRVEQFVLDTLEILSIIMKKNATGSIDNIGIDLSETARTKVDEMEEKITNQNLIELIDILMKRLAQVKSAPITELPVQIGVVEYCDRVEEL